MSEAFAKTLLVVQCRYSSSRLPGKALYPLAGLPMLAFLLQRLIAAELDAPLVLATTEKAVDDPVAAWGADCGVRVFRGAEDDVLARYISCLRQYNAEYCVRITADNPLTHPGAVADCVAALESTGCDYANALGGYPYGAGADGFSLAHLLRVQKDKQEKRYHEHLNAFALDFPDLVDACSLPAPAELAHPEVSLTVDTKEDMDRVRKIVGGLGPQPWLAGLTDVLARISE